VYTGHHYVLDVLMGVFCAVLGLLAFEALLRWAPFRRAVRRYQRAITALPVRTRSAVRTDLMPVP
jgi:membrane-associated phospholipid phosphatase